VKVGLGITSRYMRLLFLASFRLQVRLSTTSNALCATLCTVTLVESMSDSNTPEQPGPRIPFPNNQPRIWFLTAGCNPTAASIARHLLDHGDSVVAGIHPSECFSTGSHKEDFGQLLNDVSSNQEWKARLRVIRFDFKYVHCVCWRDASILTTFFVAPSPNVSQQLQKPRKHLDVSMCCYSATAKHSLGPLKS